MKCSKYSKIIPNKLNNRYVTINDRIITTYYRFFYKIVISISNILFNNEVELHKYVLTFELLQIIDNLPCKCGNLLNSTVIYGNNIY